ncbi:MAG: AAA family ATPase [Acidobacteria bacterium]|nr:AAA family ATPase [Acidobacteriota bacterium]
MVYDPRVKRVLVVGTTGSGKTTVASILATYLGVPHVEFDGLHWKLGWVEADTEELRARVRRVCAGRTRSSCGRSSRILGIALGTPSRSRTHDGGA